MTDRDKAFSSAVVFGLATLALVVIFTATGLDLGWIFAIPPLLAVFLGSLVALVFYIGKISR